MTVGMSANVLYLPEFSSREKVDDRLYRAVHEGKTLARKIPVRAVLLPQELQVAAVVGIFGIVAGRVLVDPVGDQG